MRASQLFSVRTTCCRGEKSVEIKHNIIHPFTRWCLYFYHQCFRSNLKSYSPRLLLLLACVFNMPTSRRATREVLFFSRFGLNFNGMGSGESLSLTTLSVATLWHVVRARPFSTGAFHNWRINHQIVPSAFLRFFYGRCCCFVSAAAWNSRPKPIVLAHCLIDSVIWVALVVCRNLNWRSSPTLYTDSAGIFSLRLYWRSAGYLYSLPELARRRYFNIWKWSFGKGGLLGLMIFSKTFVQLSFIIYLWNGCGYSHYATLNWSL
jgi:hypothetical protein